MAADPPTVGPVRLSRQLALLLAFLAAAIWGTAYVAAKYALRDLPPFTAAAARFLLAAALMLPPLLLTGRVERVEKRDIPLFIAAGLLRTTFYFALQYVGIGYTTAANTALIVNTRPIFVAVLSALLLHEALGWRKTSGIVLACRVLGRQMALQSEGAILNISSISGIRSLTNVAAYSAAKAAVNNFTGWLAVHMARNYSPQIRVNALAPGFFLTEQNRFLLYDAETGELTACGTTIVNQTPLRRFGTPEELAGIVIWLVSPSAAFAHGAVYTIDGGFAAFSGV